MYLSPHQIKVRAASCPVCTASLAFGAESIGFPQQMKIVTLKPPSEIQGYDFLGCEFVPKTENRNPGLVLRRKNLIVFKLKSGVTIFVFARQGTQKNIVTLRSARGI